MLKEVSKIEETENIEDSESLDDKIDDLVNKIEFNENYTAREWLSNINVKIRMVIREMLPGMYDAMKRKDAFQNSDDLLDLPLKAFLGILKKYKKFYGMNRDRESFLG